MHGPLLARAAVAACENQGRLVVGNTPLDIGAHPADAYEGAIGYAPVLTRATIAGHVDDCSALGGRTALHVETIAAYADDVSVAEGPLLILPRVTLLHVHGCSWHRIPVIFDIHALVGSAAGDLMCGGAGIQRGHHDQAENQCGWTFHRKVSSSFEPYCFFPTACAADSSARMPARMPDSA
jgi:hypothetical protein